MLFHIDFKLNTDMHVKIALNNHYRGELLVRLSLNKLLRHEKKKHFFFFMSKKKKKQLKA